MELLLDLSNYIYIHVYSTVQIYLQNTEHVSDCLIQIGHIIVCIYNIHVCLCLTPPDVFNFSFVYYYTRPNLEGTLRLGKNSTLI